MRHARRIRSGTVGSALIAAAIVAAGCGGGKDFANNPRPAVPVQLTGVITSTGVTVEPSRVGAGPIQILVSNQTGRFLTLTLDGADIQPVSTAPIGPTDTGRIKQNLSPGTYTVKAGNPHAAKRALKPARLVIGRPRPDSNDRVALP